MSNKTPTIRLSHVSKEFKRGKLLLKEALLDVFNRDKSEVFTALDDVSFSINRGETVGIIGSNGSGKSTLLKLIAGVMVPSKGKIKVTGRVAPLIELGAGFHPELTGRENIFINGTILGLSEAEILKRYADIVKFAELEEFINTPVKHYSSGMFMRLGFSVAVHVKPDILLVDEILSVGDASFQQKSFEKMEEFKNSNTTMVIVSHDLNRLTEFCDSGLVLSRGIKKFQGPIKEAVSIYKKISDLG